MTDPRLQPTHERYAWQEDSHRSEPVRLPDRASATNGSSGEPSLSELFSELSRETKTLINQEMRLARLELKERTADVGKNVASVAMGGAVLYAGFLGLMFAAIYALSEVIDPWLAALIVGLVIMAVGGFLLYRGYNELKELDLTPRRTVDSLQENAQWLKEELS